MSSTTIQNLEIPPASKKQGYLMFSKKPAGPYQIPMTVINGVKEGPILVVNGGVHGSEYNGPAATLRLMKELDPNSLKGSVIIIPMVLLSIIFR